MKASSYLDWQGHKFINKWANLAYGIIQFCIGLLLIVIYITIFLIPNLGTRSEAELIIFCLIFVLGIVILLDYLTFRIYRRYKRQVEKTNILKSGKNAKSIFDKKVISVGAPCSPRLRSRTINIKSRRFFGIIGQYKVGGRWEPMILTYFEDQGEAWNNKIILLKRMPEQYRNVEPIFLEEINIPLNPLRPAEDHKRPKLPKEGGKIDYSAGSQEVEFKLPDDKEIEKLTTCPKCNKKMDYFVSIPIARRITITPDPGGPGDFERIYEPIRPFVKCSFCGFNKYLED